MLMRLLGWHWRGWRADRLVWSMVRFRLQKGMLWARGFDEEEARQTKSFVHHGHCIRCRAQELHNLEGQRVGSWDS